MPKIFWQTVDYSSLLTEEWHGEFTVFQLQTGKTHFFNQMSLFILELLGDKPLTEDTICCTVAEQFQQENDLKFSEQVIKTLHRFDELGLIEQVHSERAAASICE